MKIVTTYASDQVTDVSEQLQCLLDTHVNGDGHQFGCAHCETALGTGMGLCLTGQILAVTRVKVEYSRDHGQLIPRQRDAQHDRNAGFDR